MKQTTLTSFQLKKQEENNKIQNNKVSDKKYNKERKTVNIEKIKNIEKTEKIEKIENTENNDEISTYIGNKGYTIFKDCLSFDEQQFIRKELTAQAYIPKSPIQPPSFPVYKESRYKLYIPRYFGIKHYGQADDIVISKGNSIDISFEGDLRDYQKNIVSTYLKHTDEKWGGGGLLEIPCGRGKCHAKNTPIVMYNGEIMMVQYIKPGDQIMGDDSTPRNVLSIARGMEMMYKIKQSDGTSYIVNKSHILSLKKWNKSTKTISTIDIPLLKYYRHSKDKNIVYYGYRACIDFPYREIYFDPYVIGHSLYTSNSIPINYKINTKTNRLRLLAGIIDRFYGYSDGMKYYITIYNKNGIIDPPIYTIIKDIQFVVHSLGMIIKEASFSINLSSEYKIYEIYGSGIEEIPVKYVKRILINHTKSLLRLEIEPLKIDNYYGFEIDGNHRYVLSHFTVTHNTVIALNIISQLSLKTLVIVHKTFLMNQWIERIEQFLPKAKVGKIQGQIMDIDNKDIVIGMLQSLSMKEYHPDTFKSFGLTIVDECHHISSEVFSQSLTKIVTKYTLGLSATMERKDGLTKIFKMFLGDILYSEERKADDDVLVKAIEYYVDDDEFNECVYDYRGNPAYSTMITKLCSYSFRSEFILKVIKNELLEKEDQQIMILAHNKNILIYLHDAIKHRNIASVGYYVGGMKEKDLKESENKKIIIATYAMASEALDIKTLSTLIFATPKTDIIQAVGRILRVKHERPLVIDIIDSHDLFQKQWQKRYAYYKKNNYTIKKTDNEMYFKNEWMNISKNTKNKSKSKLNTELNKNNTEKKCLITIDI